jgi:hypothetical protein
MNCFSPKIRDNGPYQASIVWEGRVDDRSLGRWLERRGAYSHIIVGRALLRAMPLLSSELMSTGLPADQEQRSILALLRGLAAIAHFSSAQTDEAAKAVVAARLGSRPASRFVIGSLTGELLGLIDGSNSTHTSYPSLVARLHEFIENNKVRRRTYGKGLDIYLWRNVEDDIERADEQGWGAKLDSPLDPALTQSLAWANFRAEMRAHTYEWSSWIKWLEFQIFGLSPKGMAGVHWNEVSRRVSLIDEEYWSRGPSAVNPLVKNIIRDVIRQYDEFGVERQSPLAPKFTVNKGGKIDVDGKLPRRPKSPLSLSKDIVRSASIIIQECTLNTTAALKDKLSTYLEAMSRKSASQATMIVVRGDALRRELTYQFGRDEDSDIPPLPESIKKGLEEVVAKHNLFVNMDPELVKLDRMLLGPEDQGPTILQKDVVQLLETGERERIFSDAAKALLDEIVDQTGKEDVSSRQSKRASETSKNLLRAGVSYLYNHGMKIAGTLLALPPALYGLGRWIIANEGIILGYFQRSAPMHAAIENIIIWLKTMPLL